jgi:hypothetical protein
MPSPKAYEAKKNDLEPPEAMLAAWVKVKDKFQATSVAREQVTFGALAFNHAARQLELAEARSNSAVNAHMQVKRRLVDLEGKRATLEEKLKNAQTAEAKANDELGSVRRDDIDAIVQIAKRLGEATAEAKDFGDQLTGIESDLAKSAWEEKALRREVDATAKSRVEAEEAKSEAKQAADAALKKAEVTIDEEREVQKNLDDLISPPKSKVSTELLELMAGRDKEKKDGFLAITQRGVKFDPLVRDAIEDLTSKYDITPKETQKIAEDFVRLGIASDIEKVTQRLNRQRIPDIRRAVLGAVYPRILRRRLDGSDSSDPRRTAKDTIGLTQTVLTDLDSKNGFLADFAEILVRKTVEKMGINAPKGSTHRKFLVAQMRGSL